MEDTNTEIQVRVLFFSKAREITGNKESKISVPRRLSSAELFNKIIHTFNLEALCSQVIITVNEEYLTSNNILALSETDTIAVIPPLSGGLFNNKHFV